MVNILDRPPHQPEDWFGVGKRSAESIQQCKGQATSSKVLIMRTAIAITLIVCGTLLILAPAIHNFFLAAQVADILTTRNDLTSVRGGEPMTPIYSGVCWMVGVAMVAVAVLCSMKFSTPRIAPTPAVA